MVNVFGQDDVWPPPGQGAAGLLGDGQQPDWASRFGLLGAGGLPGVGLQGGSGYFGGYPDDTKQGILNAGNNPAAMPDALLTYGPAGGAPPGIIGAQSTARPTLQAFSNRGAPGDAGGYVDFDTGQYVPNSASSAGSGVVDPENDFNDVPASGAAKSVAPHAQTDNSPELVGITPANARAVQNPHWSLANGSVILSSDMRDKANSVAEEYYNRTGRNLVVTDGSRTPADQAEAMYNKFRDGDNTTYTGASGREIRSIFDAGTAAGQDRAAIVNSMAARIQEQAANGHPVSNHLNDRAMDFRNRGIGVADQRILMNAIRHNGGTPLHEGIPPHMHGSFPLGR